MYELWFNVVNPDTFNEDIWVEALLKVEYPNTINELLMVVLWLM